MAAPYIWSPISATANPLVGGGSAPSDVLTGATNQITFSTGHICAWGPTSFLKLVFAWYKDDEISLGNGGTIKAAIWTAGGHVFPVTFSGGSRTYSFPDGGPSYVVSDPVPLTAVKLSAGSLFNVRVCVTAPKVSVDPAPVVYGNIPGGIRLQSSTSRENLALLGEGMIAGDYVDAGSIPATAFLNNAYSPSVILAPDTVMHPSIASIGDSTSVGTGDTGFRVGIGGPVTRVATGITGYLYSQTTTPRYGHGSFGKPGSTLASLADPATFNIRFQLSNFFSTVACKSDVNNSGSYTVAQTKQNYLDLIARYAAVGKNFIAIPMNPRTQSSDGFKTVRQVLTTVTTGATSATQTVGSTTGMAANDIIFFDQSAQLATVQSVTDSTHVVLTSSITTITGESVGKGQFLKNANTAAGGIPLPTWDSQVRSWENDATATGLLQQGGAIIGTDKMHVWNVAAAVSCLADGTPDPLGPYWIADLGAGTPALSGSVTSGGTYTQFSDSVNLTVTSNTYRGYVCIFTSGTNATDTAYYPGACIKYHYSGNTTASTEGWHYAPANGNTYGFYRVMSTDGTHGSSVAVSLMSQSANVVLADVR